MYQNELHRYLINPEANWDDIIGKPTLPTIHYNSTAGFAELAHTVPEAGSIYIYYDAQQKDGINIPNIKIGDGGAYLVDLPFINAVDASTIISEHIDNTAAHVSEEDRINWNNKVTVNLSSDNDERIIFSY